MKILITGSTGFLGSHLTKTLVKEGHEVIILKRSFSNTWRISDVLSNVTVFNIDECSLEQPFIEFGSIDAVIHTATMYDRYGERVSQLLDANVSFPLQLLETAMSFQTKLFINTDSFIHKNNAGYKHLAGYALTKKQFLEWGKEFSLTGKIRFINVKLEHIYGSFDSESKFSAYIMRSCLNNIPELHLTPGDQKRDFIHINDVISAYSLLLKFGITDLTWFKEYELGTGKTVTVRDYVELIHLMSQSKTELKFGAIPHRENEIMESKANIEELEKLGWKSEISLKKGIELMLADERNITNL
ncbi:NAD-dependent epimerase/dehydratase family protein [Metabacillus fastidiosus]|uniref:NAD-dependent epimerase/dehydratase family protein n=1 Tax=Metabacillus fastidiosus TaxID=1458 RepID=UPI003D265BDF